MMYTPSMQPMTIYVTPEDIEAAKRIAAKMFPDRPGYMDAPSVIGAAAIMGMEKLKVAWLQNGEQPLRVVEGS